MHSNLVKKLPIQMATKTRGNENSWNIGSCQSLSPRSHGNYRTYTRYCHLSTGRRYFLTCRSSSGNGWHGGYIKIQGKTYCRGFTSGRARYEFVTVR